MEQVVTWDSIHDYFLKVFHIEQEVPKTVLVRAVLDSTFAHRIVISRKNPNFLKGIFNDSKNQRYATQTQVADDIQLRQAAYDFVAKWHKFFAQEETKDEFNQRYDGYFEAEKKRNPEAKACKPCAEIHPTEFREVYLDHNGTTYIRPEVSTILGDYYIGKIGYSNPSSNTVQGYYTADQLLDAKQEIATVLSSSMDEIFFTGSGSEANNLAIKGIAFQHLAKKGHLITSKVEHPSVLKVMEYLETLGFAVTYLDVDSFGMVVPGAVEAAIRKDTILVSVMAANNEIGTINPIGEIGLICQKHKIPFMVDAIQAFCKINLKPREMGITLLSFSGHKIYAPKGIGGLYVEQGVSLVPQIHGGGQESGLRAGTENVGSIIALGKAAALAYAEMEQETERLTKLREFFLEELKRIEPGAVVNGSLQHRLANNLSIGIPGVDSSALLRSLNRIGISVSVGSACSSRRIKTSHVLEAIGADTKGYAAIRFSFGLHTKQEDLEYLFTYLPRILYLLKEKNEKKTV